MGVEGSAFVPIPVSLGEAEDLGRSPLLRLSLRWHIYFQSGQPCRGDSDRRMGRWPAAVLLEQRHRPLADLRSDAGRGLICLGRIDSRSSC